MTPGSGLSPNLHHLETSATIAISQEAKRRKAAGEDVIDLGAGEPDFPTPSLPSDAGVRAIREGKTHYPANEGILELRAAAAKHLSLLSGGRPVNADNIVVSNGSKQSLFNACFMLFGPGDAVAIPALAWVAYPQIVERSRARIRLPLSRRTPPRARIIPPRSPRPPPWETTRSNGMSRGWWPSSANAAMSWWRAFGKSSPASSSWSRLALSISSSASIPSEGLRGRSSAPRS